MSQEEKLAEIAQANKTIDGWKAEFKQYYPDQVIGDETFDELLKMDTDRTKNAEGGRIGFSSGDLMNEYYGTQKLDWLKNHQDQMTFEQYLRWKSSGSFAAGGRVGLRAGGTAFKEFVEALFIKASNEIRKGIGKWKGLGQKEKIVQHDNLTQAVTKFQKTGDLTGVEAYFDVDPAQAFKEAAAKVSGGKAQQLVSDDVLAKAYDEVFFQKPSSGDYKYDADVLSDSIAEQLGKESLADFPQDQQTEIYNTALKRVTDDMKMKRTLEQVEE
jgi:hypothetical protein